MASSRIIIWAKFAVLQVTNLMAAYPMTIMTTYLTSVWEINPTYASAVVNVYSAIVATMPLALHFLVDTFMGNYWMIVLSGCAYATGFFLLTMSTPPVLYKATGTCRAYEAECIGQVQTILFYTAIPLIALGRSGRFMVVAFKKEQLIKPLLEAAGSPGTKTVTLFSWPVSKKTQVMSFQFLVFILVVVPIVYLKPWMLRFGIPAICTLVSTLLLTSTVRRSEAQGIPFTREDIRSILHWCPMCIFLVVIGVVSALGNTYFIEQASNMNRKVGTLKVSVLVLTVLQNFVEVCFSDILKRCAKISPTTGISVSMILAIVCCITAALVETRRLGVVKSHGLIDKPDETVPMTIFWLLPQFVLLGCVCGISKKCLFLFFTDVVLRWPKVEKHDNALATQEESKPTEKDIQENSTEKDGDDPNKANMKEKSKRQYIDFFVDAVFGGGILGSLLSVYVVDKVKPTWFQNTTNRSQLDNYYWTLAALTAASLLVFVLVICLLRPEKKHMDDTIEIGTEPIMNEEEGIELALDYAEAGHGEEDKDRAEDGSSSYVTSSNSKVY